MRRQMHSVLNFGRHFCQTAVTAAGSNEWKHEDDVQTSSLFDQLSACDSCCCIASIVVALPLVKITYVGHIC